MNHLTFQEYWKRTFGKKELQEVYQDLGGNEETLSQVFEDIKVDIKKNQLKIELWKEWKNMHDGHVPSQINGLELAKILGYL